MRKLSVILAGCLLSTAAFGASKLVFKTGEVDISRGGKWMKAQVGMELQDSDTVRTGKKSMAIVELKNGSRLKMRYATELELSSLTGKVSLMLKRGSVFAKVSKADAAEQFRMTTPTIVAGVRGTQFFAAYGAKIRQSKKEEAMLCVNEGSVEVTLASKKILLKEGEGVVVADGEALPKGEKLPWLKSFNWNMDEKSGTVEDKTSLKKAYGKGYKDLLDEDYD